MILHPSESWQNDNQRRLGSLPLKKAAREQGEGFSERSATPVTQSEGLHQLVLGVSRANSGIDFSHAEATIDTSESVARSPAASWPT